MKMETMMALHAGAAPVNAKTFGHSTGHPPSATARPPSALSEGERAVSLG
jgi:hypothetical protein